MGFEAFAEVRPCAEEEAFDRGDGGSEDFGNFLVGHVFETPEHDRRALGLRQGRDGAGDGFLQFGVRDFLRGGAGGGVGMADRRTVGIARVERDEAGALAAAHFVEDEISGDGEQPGGEFGGGVVAGRALPDADEDLLGDVLGVGFSAQHFRDRAHDAELVAPDEGLESSLVAGFHREHECDVLRCRIVVRGVAWGHLRGKEKGYNHGGGRKAREIPLAAGAVIGFVCLPMSRPVVACYCTTFLKREMRHIYRQVNGLRGFGTFVITRARENREEYPFPDVEVLPRPRIFFLRRFYKKYLAGEEALFYRGEYKQLTKLLERRRPDLVHIYFGHTGVHLLPFVRAWGGRSLVSFHGMDIMPREDEPGYLDRLRELLRALPMVLARSGSLAARLVDLGCPPENIRINRTGIPLDRFPFAERTPPPGGAWHVVQASRLIEKKGVDSTLAAFASFRKTHPGSRLTIAGDGPLLEELRRSASAMGIGSAVRFAGFQSQEELAALFASAHIFMHPSRLTSKQDQEGVPNSMLEAMATGLPVVATLHGGIPEAVEDGRDGLLTPENDPGALAASLERIAGDPDLFRKLGSNASGSVRAKYEQAAAIRSLEGFYRELTERKPV